MSQPFLGQIQSFGFGFAPVGWLLCNGQILAVNQYTALFSLIGTTYGGNGTTTFQLPNLQSRIPMHYGTAPNGNTYVQGEQGGEENVTLILSNLPLHNHNFYGSSQNANSGPPANGAALATAYEGTRPAVFYYAPSTSPQPLIPTSLGMAGGSLPHPNLQPYQAISWCIAMVGIYPSRS